MDDDTIFSEEGVTINRSLARFGGISYSISNINSVFIVNGSSPAPVLWVLAGLLALVGLGNLSSNSLSGLVFVLVAGAIGYAAYKAKRKHVLMLKTSSGDQQAFTATDQALLARMKMALEQAISMR